MKPDASLGLRPTSGLSRPRAGDPGTNCLPVGRQASMLRRS
jgi:hypothetical protein